MAEHGTDEPSSRTGSPDGECQVLEDRSLLHQRLAVRELIDTEVSYLHMLQLCASDIRSRLQQVSWWGCTQPSLGRHGSWLLRPHIGFRGRLDGGEGVMGVKPPGYKLCHFCVLAMQHSARPLTHWNLSVFICYTGRGIISSENQVS